MAPESEFIFPIKVIESDRVKLVPYDSAIHADPFFAAVQHTPDIFRYLPYGPFASADDLTNNWYRRRIGVEKTEYLWAVYAKDGYGKGSPDKSEEMAGVVGLLYSSVPAECTEIGFIQTFQPHQRSFLTTHAIALLLFYCLDRPENPDIDPLNPEKLHSAPPPGDSTVYRAISPASTGANAETRESGGGLGLRRVQWQAHHLNGPSVNAAKRLGFRMEGITRWQRTLPAGKEGCDGLSDSSRVRRLKGGSADEVRGNGAEGRHSAVLSVCWDDWWEEGARERVWELMRRE